MKKVLVSAIALSTLAGCTYYDYYKGGVRYTQDGTDCIYYSGEYGQNFSADIRGLDNGKKIVYRNTRCEDLYARDMMGQAPRQDRQILAPAAAPVYAAPVATPCNTCAAAQPVQVVAPCHACNQPISTRKYVIVSAM